MEAGAVHMCATAIAVGAPMYNAGLYSDCACLYSDTAEQLLDQESLPESCIEALAAALDRAKGLHSASHRAWAMRLALDACLSYWVPDDVPVRMKARSVPKVSAVHRESALSCLPEDLTLVVLQHLSAVDLGVASCICSDWRRDANQIAEARLRAFRELPEGTAAVPCWARALRSYEELEAAVGPKPMSPWWREWASMRMEEVALMGQEAQFADPALFLPGGAMSIAALLRRYVNALSWMLDAGFPLTKAAACLLLSTHGTAALSRALREGSREYAASTHAVSEALLSRAWCLASPAPPTFASMHGSFGLASSDPAWFAFLEPDAAPGTRIRTSATILAIRDPASIPDEQGAITQPAEQGLASQVGCAPLEEAPLVCFHSEFAQGSNLRSLVQTSPNCYQLPPLASITLESVQPAGTWQACGRTVYRRCFVCVVSIAY